MGTKDLARAAVLLGLVRFAVTPPPKTTRSPRAEGFPAQLALAQIHPRLAPVRPVPGGFALDAELSASWFELAPQRGLAGYGLARALRILLDVLNGLIALHDTKTESGAPFVHGEVVPALVRVDRQGVGRLVPLAPWHRLEAGVAAQRDRQGHLAPERLLGDAIDQRADVFSCGVLLWEALAGRRLFETDSIDSIVTRLMGGKLQLPELPPELAWAMPLKAVVMCALAVDPAQRFAECAELAAAIEDVAGAHVATHDDIALYFGAREAGSQPPLAGLIVPPSHSSSLSALVSPAIARKEPVPPPLPAAATEPPPPSTARRLWAASALLCVLGTLGLSALARYNAAHANLHGAPSAAALPIAARAVAAPAPAPAPAPALSSDLAASAAPAASVASEVTPTHDVSGQPATGSHPNKAHPAGLAAKTAGAPAPAPAATHRPAKPSPVRDKTADEYGI